MRYNSPKHCWQGGFENMCTHACLQDWDSELHLLEKMHTNKRYNHSAIPMASVLIDSIKFNEKNKETDIPQVEPAFL